MVNDCNLVNRSIQYGYVYYNPVRMLTFTLGQTNLVASNITIFNKKNGPKTDISMMDFPPNQVDFPEGNKQS